MNKFNINEIPEKERDDVLEHFMKKCSELEAQVAELKERVNRLVWQLTEHD